MDRKIAMDEKDLNVAVAIKCVSARSFLLWVAVTLIGFLLLWIDLSAGLFTEFEKLFCTIIYAIIVIITAGREILFSCWKNDPDCHVLYRKILIISNLYGVLMIVISAITISLEAIAISSIKWFILFYALMFIAIPIIVYINRLIFAVSILLCCSILTVLGFVFNQLDISGDIYVFFLVINIFLIVIVYTKTGSEIKNYDINKKVTDKADEQNEIIQNLLKENNELKREQIIDPLTELYNRPYLEKEIKSIIQKSLIENKSICIVMIDIDDFKQVNEKYGRKSADKCLRQLATLIKENSISNNGLAFRYIGEEFLMVFRGVKLARVKQYMTDLEQIVATTYFKDIPLLKLSISTGIAEEMPRKGLDFYSMIDEADRRLKAHKESKIKKPRG